MMPAKQDSYKRVYKADGFFHYPKLHNNKLQQKGEEYFKSLDVTGNLNGTEKCPKFSLVEDYFKTHKFPALDCLVATLDSNQPGVKHVVRYQMDGAGPH
jgi:hypothetical protein